MAKKQGAIIGTDMKIMFIFLALLVFMTISHAALSTTYNGQTATIKNGGTTIATVQILNKMSQNASGAWFIKDCDLFTCDLILNVTPSFDYTFDGSTKINGAVRASTKGKTSFNGLFVYDIRQVNTTNPTYSTIERDGGNGTHYYEQGAQNGTATTSQNIAGYYPLNSVGYKVLAGNSYKIKQTYTRTDAKDISDLVPSLMGISLDNFAWWNTTWLKKIAVNVSTVSNFTGGYQIPMNLTLNASFKSDGSDIRCVNSSEDGLIGCWAESSSAGSWIYFWANASIVNTNGTAFYIYYNNSAATAAWNGDSTFPFFDDFDGSINTTSWTWKYLWSDACTAVTSGGKMYVGSKTNGGCDLIEQSKSFSNNIRFRLINYSVTVVPQSNYPMEAIGMLTSNSVAHFESSYNAGNGYTSRWYAITASNLLNVTWFNSAAGATETNLATGSLLYTVNSPFNMEVRVNTTVQWLANATLFYNNTDTTYRTSLYPRIQAYAPTATGNCTTIDAVFVGVWADNEPTYALGAEEVPITAILTNVTVNVTDLGTTNTPYITIVGSGISNCSFLTFKSVAINSGTLCQLNLTAGNLSYAGTVTINDTVGTIVNHTANFTISNNSYVMNSTTSSTESAQYFVKSDTATSNNGSAALYYNLVFSTPTSATVDWNSGAGTMNATVTGGWHGDWINVSTQGTYGQNTTGIQNATRNDFNSSLSWAANSTMPAKVNFTYNLPTADVGGTCDGDTYISGAGTYTGSLAASGTGAVQTQAYARCITATNGSFALQPGYTNLSQILAVNNTWISLWSGNLASVNVTHLVEGSACWDNVTQLSGLYTVNTGGGTIALLNQSGDCIVEGVCSFAVLGTPTEAAQTIQCSQPLNSSDTSFTFSVPWSRVEGTACWTTGLQQTGYTATLNSASMNLISNQTGDCTTDGAESGWTQRPTATFNSTVAIQYINNTRSIANLDAYTFTGLTHTWGAVPNACFSSVNGTPVTYTLAASATIGQDANASGDCITEVIAPVNTTQNVTQQPYIYYGNSTLYMYGNATATTLFNFQNISWSYTDSYIYFNSTNLRQNMTFNLTTASPGLIQPYWYVNLSTTQTNYTTSAWAPYYRSSIINITDDPYLRSSGIWFAYLYGTAINRTMYKCSTGSGCSAASATGWSAVTTTDTGTELRRTANDSLSNVSYLISFTAPMTMTWNSQVPSDINSTNVIAVGMNASYTSLDGSGSLINSTIYFSYKTNTSSLDCSEIINGTARCGYTNLSRIGIINTTALLNSTGWKAQLSDNDILPGTYNYNETYMESTVHLNTNLTTNNAGAAVKFLNVSNSTRYGWFEIMANTSGPGAASIYYCNSTYTTGQFTTSPNCAVFGTIAASASFNHTHTPYSLNQVILFAVNNGSINNITVTSNSTFVILNAPSTTWQLWYIANTSRTDAAQTTTNRGNTWTNVVGTFDSHLHQFTGNETLYYFMCANSTATSTVCSATTSDNLDLTILPPVPPNVITPTEAYYEIGTNININYTNASTLTAGTVLSYFKLELVNNSGSTIATIAANNSLNTNYTWNTTGSTSGIYFVKVTIYDNYSQSAYSLSPEISLYNTSYPAGAIYETNYTTFGITLTNLSIHTSVSKWLNWSGTMNATNTTFTFQPALEATNNTAHNWNWIINGTDGVTVDTNVSQTRSTSVLFAYVPLAVQFPLQMLENTNYTANLSIYNPLNIASLAADLYLNATRWMAYQNTTTVYSNTSILTPTLTVSSASLSTNGSLNITWGGATKNRSIAGSNSTVFQFTLANCANSSYAINFSQYDELTNASLNFSVFNAIAQLYTSDPTFNRAYTFNLLNVSYAAFCITPANFPANMSWTVTYGAADTNTTSYELRGMATTYQNLSSPTSNYNVSLYNVGNGTYYTFIVKDPFNQPIPTATVQSTRNSLVTEILLTNPDGSAALLMQPFFPYTIDITKTGYVPYSFNFTPSTISTINIILEPINVTAVTIYTLQNLLQDVNFTVLPSATYFNTTFNIIYSIQSLSSALTWYAMNITYMNSSNYSQNLTQVFFGNASVAAGGFLNYTVPGTAFGTYYVDASFRQANYSDVYTIQRTYKLTNSTGAQQAANDFNAGNLLGGWTFYFIGVFLAMMAVGFISKYSMDGAGLVALIILWAFTFFSPN